jgi:type II secretory pathway pseudopilin PulG
MVVIALIGIVSAMIIPEMRGTYEEALLRSTSRRLVNLCNLAYSQSVSLQEPHRIHLDPRTGRFALERRAPHANQPDMFVPAENVPGAKGELDDRISIKFHRNTENEPETGSSQEERMPGSQSSEVDDGVLIRFYPDGTADPAEILLRDRQGFRLLLRISPVTSRVGVRELARE